MKEFFLFINLMNIFLMFYVVILGVEMKHLIFKPIDTIFKFLCE